jgi:hypothetical protein
MGQAPKSMAPQSSLGAILSRKSLDLSIKKSNNCREGCAAAGRATDASTTVNPRSLSPLRNISVGPNIVRSSRLPMSLPTANEVPAILPAPGLHHIEIRGDVFANSDLHLRQDDDVFCQHKLAYQKPANEVICSFCVIQNRFAEYPSRRDKFILMSLHSGGNWDSIHVI